MQVPYTKLIECFFWSYDWTNPYQGFLQWVSDHKEGPDFQASLARDLREFSQLHFKDSFLPELEEWEEICSCWYHVNKDKLVAASEGFEGNSP